MPEQLAPGVIRIPTTRRDNAFLFEGDKGYTLVDVGWASAPKAITAALADLSRKPTDITRIVITHAHPDHVQGAGLIRELTGAPLLIHPAENTWLQAGRVPRAGRSGALGRALDRLPKLHWQPLSADGPLTDGQLIDGSDGLRVLHTPGHSPGHIALVHEPTRTLLTGDAVFHRSERALGPAQLAADPHLRTGSLARIPRDLKAVGFAHGTPLTGSGVDTFHEWLNALQG
ncbi:MBL fold metallo-hydrolase [Streptomyces sp. TP-A0356]|uniref:MBL fold metallo-hydrolase n=1 Tax=Streptomyces sp. TP-A0356 TaxID=1359208 RepID=UPI0006E467BC|nr:MBL fold metallo-hydrolase [Streptomyces sp. TP-A0356]